jgi:hypothetical protein
MSLRSLLFLVLVAAAGSARVGQAQEPIAKVKSAPQDYRDRQIQLEGEVVEIRGLSPRSGRGSYRLIDESDPVGLLVRTASLPESGGPFRVRARLSPELLQDGILLVDELDRDLTRSPMLPVAFLIGALGFLGCLAMAGMYLRARRTERRLRLGPPTWLIPSAVEEPESAGEHDKGEKPVQFNYRLHYVEQERSSGLEQRKRQLLMGLAGAAVVTATGAGWYAVLRGEDAAKPAFVLTAPAPTETLAVAARTDSAVADSQPAPIRRPDDTLRIGLAAPVTSRPAPRPVAPAAAETARPRPPRETATAQPQAVPARRDSVPLRRDTTPFRQDTARVGSPVVVVTGGARETPVTTQPVPAVQPPPPPATESRPDRDTAPAVRRDTTPSVPPPDPAALRRAATAELEAGILRFVNAVQGKQMATVAAAFSSSGDTRRRDQFVEFLRQNSPSATLKGSGQPAVAESGAETTFIVEFRWRAQFGVERKKDGRFGATARRSGNGWEFGNIRLLEAFP